MPMRLGWPRILGIAALAVAAMVLALQLFLSWRASQPLAGLRGTPLQPARSVTPLEMTDQSGASVRFPIDGTEYTLAFFGYTHCPDVCPLALATMARADRALGAPKQLGLAFVTVDPGRDTPATLTTFTRAFDARITGFTSDPAQLATLYNEFGVLVAPASRELIHGESIYLVDDDGRILVEYPPDGSASDIEHDVRVLLHR